MNVSDNYYKIQQQVNENSRKLDEIKQLTENIHEDIYNQEVYTSGHPILFVFMVIFFFITMDLWVTASGKFLMAVHPKNRLSYWDYFIIAIIATVILVYLSRKTGFSITQLETANEKGF